MENKNIDYTLPKTVALIVGVAFLTVTFFSIGFGLGRITKVGSLSGYEVGSSDPSKSDMSLYWTVWNTLDEQYVDESKIDPDAMYYGSIKGMVQSYNDPATIFLDPDETSEYNNTNAGKLFEGIGAELGYENGAIVIVTPIAGSPAESAGLKPGDIILKIDDFEVQSTTTVYDAVALIRGEAGSDVVLNILSRGDTEPRDVIITRRQITLPSIEIKDLSLLDKDLIQYEDDVVLISLSRFTENSLSAWEDEWDNIVDETLRMNPKAIIIDLRNNPGGYFDAAIYASEDFLPRGTIVSKQEDRKGGVVDFKVEREGELIEIPVIILVNEGSASASEILTGALQYNDRAKVVGVETYGKGTAQSVIPFSDGSSLHITVLKWLLPDGSWLNNDNPIVPDIIVEKTEEDFENANDPQLERAIEELKKEVDLN